MYNNEKDLLRKFKLPSWERFSVDNFPRFISIMPEMSDELRMKVIEQIPNFVQICTESLTTAKEAFMEIMDKNDATTNTIINKIDFIRDNIASELKREGISEEYRKFIILQLMELSKLYSKLDDKNKKFFETTFGQVLKGMFVIVGGFAAFIGGKFLLSLTENDNKNDDIIDVEPENDELLENDELSANK